MSLSSRKPSTSCMRSRSGRVGPGKTIWAWRGSAWASCSRNGRAGRGKEGAVDKMKLTRSSGNVFRDLGFSGDEAEHLKVRAELMVHVQHVITARGLKQAEAAALLG